MSQNVRIGKTFYQTFELDKGFTNSKTQWMVLLEMLFPSWKIHTVIMS